MRRVLLVLGGAVAALLLTVVAFAALVLATAPGHALMRRYAIAKLSKLVDGRVRIEAIGGSLWRLAEVRGIELATPSGRPVISAERLRVGYAIPDLLRGRLVLSRVSVIRPVVSLEQDSSGVWNIERLLRLNAPDTGAPGRRPWVELRDVRLTDGTVTVTPWPASGAPRKRTFAGVNLELTRLRASHPDSTAVEATFRRVTMRIDHPQVALHEAAGVVSLDGDSVSFALEGVRFGQTRASLSGRAAWGGPRVAVDAEVNAPSFAFADLHPLERRLPESGTGVLEARVRWLASGAQEYEVRRLELATGRSEVRASGRLARSASGSVSLRDLDATLGPLDLALLAPWVGEPPAHGLLSGRVRADGALADLALVAELRLSDEDARPVALSSMAGRGRAGWSARAGVAVRGFEVARSSLSLVTLRRLAPELPESGRLEVSGRLAANSQAIGLSGRLAYLPEPGQVSSLRGSMRLELGDSAGLEADVVADSLSFDGLRHVVAGLPLRGTAAGRLRVTGPFSALGYELGLSGAWGYMKGKGAVSFSRAALVVVGEGTLDSVDLNRHDDRAPHTRLSGAWTVALTFPSDSARPPSGNLELNLGHSFVERVPLSASVGAAFVGDRLMLDSALLGLPGGALQAAGAIGLPEAPAGQITFGVRLDTMAALVPALRWAMGSVGDSGEAVLEGRGRITGRVVGTTSNWETEASVALEKAVAGQMGARNLHATARLTHAGALKSVWLELSADSLNAYGLAYAPAQVSLSGSPDSLRVRLSAGFVAESRVSSVLSLRRDTASLRIGLDTLQLELPVGRWSLARPASVAIASGAIAVDSLELRAARGAGRVVAHGALPRRAPGNFTLRVDSLALADVLALAGRDTSGISGALDLAARIGGPAESPLIDLSIFVAQGRFGEYRAPEIQLLGTYQDRKLSLKGGLWRQGNRAIALAGSLPLDLSLNAVERRRLPGPLTLSAGADSTDLSVFSAVTEAVRELSGTCSFDLRATGSWDSWTLTGFAEFRRAAVTVPALGVRYRDIDARLELEDTTIRVVRATARGGDGTLEVAGSVYLGALSRPVLDLVLGVRRFNAFEIRSFAGLTGSGRLSLRGPAIGAELSGRLTVDQGYLRFADLVEKRVVNLDDPEFRAIVDSTLARATGLAPGVETVFLDSLRVRDLTVSMGPDVWLRSSEANIQLAGEFQVAKDIEFGLPRYRLDGTMRAVRGNYRLVFGDAISREFRVTRGTVRFFGTPDFNPELDIAAEHVVRRAEGGNLTVRAVIGGTLQQPRLRLESDERPPLTETELVSYLMFGRPASQITQRGPGRSQLDPLRDALYGGVAELGQALIGGFGVPLDVFTVRPGAGGAGEALGNARIEAGVQVGSRTFLTLNAGLCEVRTSQALGVSIEYRLGSRWTTGASLEPVVRDCRAGAGALSSASQRYQVGFDLFWTLGGLR